MQCAQLFRRLWFEHIWIIQEVATATKATVICGYRQMSGSLLTNIIDVLYAISQLITFIERATWQIVTGLFAKRANHRELQIQPDDKAGRTFLQAIVLPGTSKARIDKPYTLTDMLREADIPFLARRRSATWRRLQKDSCVRDCSAQPVLHFLSCRSYGIVLRARDLRSWGPDWSLPPDPRPSLVHGNRLNAAGSSDAHVLISPDGEISIARGKLISLFEVTSQLDCPAGRAGMPTQQF